MFRDVTSAKVVGMPDGAVSVRCFCHVHRRRNGLEHSAGADASEPVGMPVPKKAERHSVRVLIGKYRRGKEHTSNNEGISHS